MKPLEILLALLRNVLWGKELPRELEHVSAEVWFEVVELAVDQGVQTLICDALETLPDGTIPEELAENLRSLVHTVEVRNRTVKSVADAQARAWTKNGLGFAMMKGVSVARMYPHPEHRLPGDIDWYFTSEEDWKKANAVAARVTGAEPEKDSDGDVHYVWQNVTIEHHRGWSHLSSRRARKVLPQVPDIVDGYLSPLDDITMLFGHILHHICSTGAGLRQVCDLEMALEFYDGKYDAAALDARISALGLGKWMRLLRSVIEESQDGAVSEKDRERLMRLILGDGSLGLAKKRRFSGFAARTALLLRYCPGEYFARWFNLAAGRLKKRI